MRNVFLAFLIMSFVSSCKKVVDTECLIPSISFSLADKTVAVTSSDIEVQNGFEIEYGPADFAQGSGTTQFFSSTSTTFTVADYGSFDVYIRKKCASGSVSGWSSKFQVSVDGSSSDCSAPVSLDMYTGSNPYKFMWYPGTQFSFYDVEYGPTGFTIGEGTRLRTNDAYTYDAILHQGTTYDFYVRGNCGGTKFSGWAGPRSVYAAVDCNLSVPCTAPTNLYAYKTSSTELNYTSVGHGSISYEVSVSSSNTTNTGNILSVSSPNGGLYRSSGYSGINYLWIRGKCVNNQFTAWAITQVQ
ncbi:MAG: hypothetical protein IPH78_03605 [Bacteroidetes bacterium]|nr:hypothetical protein [Bacteroidota bacterium]